MSMMSEDPVFDADQHYYEPLDAFTRHLPKEWGKRTVQRAEIDGRVRFIVGGKINTTVRNPTFDPIVKPGSMTSYFRGNPEGLTIADCLSNRESIPDYYRNRDARIAKMDDQNLQYAWMLPTIGMAYEEMLQFDPEAAGVAYKAFNRWLLDDWAFNHEGRIFSSPYLAMGDREAALEEVEFGLANGARIFVVRPSGIYTEDGWRSPGDPWFDPIWERIAEARAVVIPHVADVGGVGLDRYMAKTPEGIIQSEPPALQIAIGHERPIANYLSAMVCDRLFERVPTLQVASIENGADFLPLVLSGLRRAGFQRKGYFKNDPVETFKQNIWVAPFWEDNLVEAVEHIGEDRILFGSDWPHPEGMETPRDFEHEVDALNNNVAARKIMFENAAKLTGIEF